MVASLFTSVLTAEDRSQPNLLLIYCDDLGWGDGEEFALLMRSI